MVKENHLEEKLLEIEIKEAWKEIVGEFMEKHTGEITALKGGILLVKIDSSACREELSYKKSEIILQLNQKFKKELVKEIKFK
jgi:hypothetical protein